MSDFRKFFFELINHNYIHKYNTFDKQNILIYYLTEPYVTTFTGFIRLLKEIYSQKLITTAKNK